MRRHSMAKESPKAPKCDAVDKVLDRLSAVKKNGSGFTALCPAHDDTKPSLSIKEKDGRILLYCQAGCDISNVLKAAELDWKDLFIREKTQPKKEVRRTVWEITALDVTVVAAHIRIDFSDGSKSFIWRRNGKDGLNGLRVVDLPLYGLKWTNHEPSDSVRDWIIVEGEKCADALHEAGYLALGTVTGASGCPSEDSLIPLLNRRVDLWPDNDKPGKEHMKRTAARLTDMGIEVYMINWTDGPPKADAVDFLAQGGNVDELLKTAVKWEPQQGVDSVGTEIQETSSSQADFAPDLIEQICDKGWLKSYIDWARTFTDAPLAFHLACALALLAVAMGNTVWTTAWGRNIYPSIWVLIISPSGFFRKSTCIRFATKILKCALNDPILPTEWSREKLVELLANNPTGLFEWDEFGQTLAMMNRDYNLGTKEMLTKLYDSTDSHSRTTKTSGSAIIQNPAFSIIAGSTTDWMQGKVKNEDLRGGFIPRFLIIPGTKKEPEKDFNIPLKPEMEEELSYWLVKLSKLEAQVDFTPVKPLFRDWVRKHERDTEGISPELMGFMARQETNLLKLSIIIAASINNEKIEITEEVLNKAILLLDCVKQGVIATFDELAIPYEGKQLQQVRELLRRHCPLTKSKALRLSNIPASKFNPLLETLKQTGEVELIYEPGQGTNKNMLYWRG